MSVTNIVKNIKQIHPEYVALIKIGKFYYSYGKDAYIISYIFNYKIKKVEENVCVCAFPVSVTKKVLAKLEENKINCWGVRPVVSLISGVYAVSGDGTPGNPFVLGKD